MLASKYRLKAKEIDQVKREGTIHQSENFGASILKREDGGPLRFGFIISKKISNHAVQRNRIKRAMSEAVRHNLHKLEQGSDVAFLPKVTIASKSTDEIMKEVSIFILNNLQK
ncbi:MAG: ribonuclease P protein component [Patescibacteria group bacterium]